jgi:hypothetical protein
MAPDPISTAYFINPFLLSLRVFMYMMLGNGSVKSCRGNGHTRNDRIAVGHVIFYAVLVVSKESM